MTISSKVCDQSIACLLNKSLFWCLSCARFSFSDLAILWIFLVLLPNQKQRQRNSYKLPEQGKRTNCLQRFSKGTEKYASFKSSLHMYSPFCNMYFRFCKPFILKWHEVAYMHSVASNLLLFFEPHPSFLQGICCYVACKLPFWWLNVSDGSFLQHFFCLQFHQFYPFATHYWLGRDFWMRRFWIKWNFVSFCYVQNFRILCYFHPGSSKMFQSSS